MTDYIASFLLIVAMYFIGKNYWWGWLINILATSLWIIVGLQNEIYGLVITNIVLLFIGIRNAYKWYKNLKIISNDTS